jgi:osmotically-inducible protein OsmY
MNQSQKQLSLWVLLLLVLVALATERATAQAKSAPFDDVVIGERVKAAINEDAGLRTMDIGIAVQQKVVHLGGFVYSLADVQKAGAIGVRGVSAVTSSIRVRNRPSRA